MLRKRIIFTLIYENGNFTQSRNFRLQKVGDIGWLEKFYKFQEIAFSLDELIVLDATRGTRDQVRFAETLSRLVDDVFIPVSAGGGIRCIEDAEKYYNSGADKIVINTSLYANNKLVSELSKRYGAQSLIASIDYKYINGSNKVFIENGLSQISTELEEYVSYVESCGIGEIYLNSMDNDGTGFGYDFETIGKIANSLGIPLIIAGGAGNSDHFKEALSINNVNAVATANLFNFIGNGLPLARSNLFESGVNLANWKNE
jgi:imidazole glycerol-phosphate synthase subunit HisF